ncbi:MAG TPA: alpha/beta fold hydrolase [Bacteriovoracaceae bacterium]|nr:alpha/beta fold hydrolase [Bacteriovoracaceae bacterium]
MKLLMTLVLLIYCQLLSAVAEKDLPYLWNEEILPHFHTLNHDYMINSKGLKVSHYSLTNSSNSKTLVIIPGRTESSMKYAEVIYDLRHSGFDIFIIDHQGQGFSDRVLRDPHKGYVRHFHHYVDDVAQWMEEVVKPKSEGKELFLFAHSMGGAIAVHYMAKHPEVFKRAVLSAPMLQINTHPYSELVAKLYSKLLITLRKATGYTPGWGPYLPEEDIFENNTNTHSELRFKASRSLLEVYPELIVHAPTVRWTHEALKATEFIHYKADKIKTSLLLFQSGKDQTVKPERQNQFCKRAANCRISYYPNSFHEPLMEVDEIRNQAMKELKDFLK